MQKSALFAVCAATLACAPMPRSGASRSATTSSSAKASRSATTSSATPTKSANPAVEPKTSEQPPLLRSHGYEVWLDDQTGDVQHAGELEAWVQRALAAVSETTGGASERIHIVARQGGGGATTRGRTITLNLRDGPRPARRSSEWVLPHELIHASFPSLQEPDLWLEEGLATYLEPLVRVRAGQLAQADLWRDLARDLPQGAPQAGEGGLRGTRTWHRLYWQGAVFWLQAELAVFRRTGGQRSLSDGLCAWARLEDADDFDAERAFTAMDAALGQPILFELYRKASAQGIDQNPTRLLAELGVARARTATDVSLDESAPAAALRRRLTQPSPRPCAR